jgi:menaquinone-dependent protoporphyrinogen IX oxidase
MNGIIIYVSKHLGNTKKIALAISAKTKFQAIDFEQLPADFDIAAYDVVGIGSGIYARNFDHKLVKYLKSLKPAVEKQKIFLFSTAGSPNVSAYAQKKVEELLTTSNHEIIGK